MKGFEEYQSPAAKAPQSLRNNRDRIDLPVLGLQAGAGRLASLSTKTFASGKLGLTTDQRYELQNRLAGVLWCAAVLSGEAGIRPQDVAAHIVTQIRARTEELDPDRR